MSGGSSSWCECWRFGAAAAVIDARGPALAGHIEAAVTLGCAFFVAVARCGGTWVGDDPTRISTAPVFAGQGTVRSWSGRWCG